MSDAAECRGCGKILNGKPYHMGGPAYHPKTGERCPVNFYGGFVCSEACDRRASLVLERTMPGHDARQESIGSFARASLYQNWGQP